MVIFKASVRIKTFTPALLHILSSLEYCDRHYDWLPDEIVVTSINDGKHVVNSRHYTDEAIDVRSKSIDTLDNKLLFVNTLKSLLGPKFTVLFEDIDAPNEHIHIQVKKGLVWI